MMSQAKLLSNLILIKNYTRKKEELKSKSHCSWTFTLQLVTGSHLKRTLQKTLKT